MGSTTVHQLDYGYFVRPAAETGSGSGPGWNRAWATWSFRQS